MISMCGDWCGGGDGVWRRDGVNFELVISMCSDWCGGGDGGWRWDGVDFGELVGKGLRWKCEKRVLGCVGWG